MQKLIITEMFAFISIGDKGEGVLGAISPNGGWFPMVGADMDRVDSLRELAKMICNKMNVEYELVKFSNRETLEIYKPLEQLNAKAKG